jgi:hypothetical protein
MRNIVFAGVAVAIMVVTAGAAGADPDPTPPGYQIPTPNGPAFPGVQTYQPVCLTAPLACGLRFNPSTGTWQQPGTGSS